ncbi:hypothetical protein QE410_000963 [Microbacterium sp. SORGH_AS 1204]|nr:hypothetical protein [Microbacterium sp. SORGH_AS_1204]
MKMPIGMEMTAAASVIRTVPTMACSAPPPSPTTLRIEELKNSPLQLGAPRVTTVKATDTRGTIAMRNASVTTPVTSRSTALRCPSTMVEMTVMSTR